MTQHQFYMSVDRTCYRLGTLDGPLAARIEEFLDVQPLSGDVQETGTRPVFLSGSQVNKLNTTESDLLRTIVHGGSPITLLNPSVDDINALHDILRTEQHYSSPAAAVAAYSVRRSEGAWAQATFYGAGDAAPTGKAAELDLGEHERLSSQAASLADWVFGSHPEMPAAPPIAQDNGHQNLTDLISAWVDVRHWDTYYGTFQITSFAWMAHAMVPKDDYFYLQQKCVFRFNYKVKSGYANFWERRIHWFDDNRYASGDYPRIVTYEYPIAYEIDCQPEGVGDRPDLVTVVQSSPPTSQGSSTWTVGVTWSVGGNVVAGVEEQGIGVNAGVSVSNSETVTVNDVSVINRSLTSANNSRVEYVMPMTRPVPGDRCYNRLSTPVPVQRGTFQPQNDTVWKAAAALRQGRTHFRVKVALSLTNASSTMASWPRGSNPEGDCNLFTCDCGSRSSTHVLPEEPYFLDIPFPATKPRKP